MLADGLRDELGLYDKLAEGDWLDEGETERDVLELGDNEAEGLRLLLGLTDADIEDEGLADDEGLREALAELLGLVDVEGLVDEDGEFKSSWTSTPTLLANSPLVASDQLIVTVLGVVSGSVDDLKV